tara:strand:+ start:74 stop:961 length:888 start_codon:yes stop_codon:yes gene_type:complete
MNFLEENESIITSEKGLNLFSLFKLFWLNKIFILLVVFCFSLISIFYSYTRENIYLSNALVEIGNSEEQLSQNSQALEFLGINQNVQSPEKELLAKLESIAYFNFLAIDDGVIEAISVNNHKLIPVFKKKNFNLEKGINLNTDIPEEFFNAYETFFGNLHVAKKSNTSFLELGYKSPSPELSKKMTDLIFQTFNEYERTKTLLNSERYIEYLYGEAKLAPDADVKKLLFSLIESEYKKIAIVNVNQDYALKEVSPAIIEKIRISPNRYVHLGYGLFLGLFFSLFYILYSYYVRKS